MLELLKIINKLKYFKGGNKVDVCEKIFDSIEEDGIKINDEIYTLVLKEFEETTKIKNAFLRFNTQSDNVRNLKEQYIYNSKYTELFFKILAKHDYYMKGEIKDAMFDLGHLKNPNRNKKIIRKLLNSPIIQDISFNGKNEFTIISKEYGKFVFELASYYFRENKSVIDYMKNNSLPCRCHDHTYFLSKQFDDFFAITSLCQNYFKDTYYHHSYTHYKDSNLIIDLCHNAIIDKDMYYGIFEPQEISVILNSKVKEELALTNQKTDQPSNRCYLLKIALYKEYLNSIGYQGTIEEAPSMKRL